MRTNTLWGLLVLISLPACNESQNFAGGVGGRGNLDSNPSLLLKQVDRGYHTDSFIQGAEDEEVADFFLQGEKYGSLDLLMVVDNSGSMSEEQANLSTKLEPLLSEVQRANWQIGIISTTLGEPCETLVKKTSPTRASKFREGVTLGANSGDIPAQEIGLYKAREALGGTCEGQQWLRSDSTLAVVIVSDEDNCSDGTAEECAGKPESLEAEYLLSYLEGIRTPGVDAKVYGLLQLPDEPCPGDNNLHNEGTIYLEAIDATNGTAGSICGDYTATLREISSNISKILESAFSLSTRPKKESVIVRLNGVVVPPERYTITSAGVKFIDAPADGDEVEVSYLTADGALRKSFNLSEPASAEGVVVSVDGKRLSQESFYLDETNQSIVFDEPPGLDKEVVITYREQTALQNEFEIEAGLIELQIFINDVETTDFSYDRDLGLLVFDQAPPDGAIIKVLYSF